MEFRLAHSVEPGEGSAVDEVCHALGEGSPSLVIFFSDSERFDAFSVDFGRRYPGSVVMGASTHASFSPSGFCRHGINAAAVFGDIQVEAGVIREITREPDVIYQGVVADSLDRIGRFSPTPDDTCCLVLNPAGTACEENVLDTLATVLEGTGIPVFGGSASSEACVAGSVSLDGETFANGSVYALIHLGKGRLRITQENIFRPMGVSFVATGSDPRSRVLRELDGRPAEEVLEEALGVDADGLAVALAEHPFGRKVDGQLFIDEVERVNGDGGITTYCRILEGSEVTLLEPCEYGPTMADTLARVHDGVGSVDFSVIVNCFSRTQMYLDRGWMDAFTHDLANSLGSYVGLTSHGEQLGRYQLNLTLLILSFCDAR